MAFDVSWMQNTEYDAGEDRVLLDVIGGEAGVRKPTHFKVTPTGSGLQIAVAAGKAVVIGTTASNQGMYAVRSTAVENVTADAAPGGGQSRYDLVVLEVLDGQVTGAGTGGTDNTARIRIVKGTAASSPTEPTVPNSSIVLARLNITAGLSTLTTGNIQNRRTLGGPGPYVGDMKFWPSTAMLPAGWLPRDGRAISRTVYADLWELLGTTYGAGDGSTTFNLPDDRGRVQAGMDSIPTAAGGTGAGVNVVADASADSLGGAHGEENHLLSLGEMPSHGHPTISGGSVGFVTSPASGAINVANSSGGTVALTNGPMTIAFVTGNTGGGASHENMQPTRFYIPLIKY